jgi:hypothetical protein
LDVFEGWQGNQLSELEADHDTEVDISATPSELNGRAARWAATTSGSRAQSRPGGRGAADGRVDAVRFAESAEPNRQPGNELAATDCQ